MATVNIQVTGTVGISRLLTPKVMQNGGTAIYSLSIENPQFAPAKGSDPNLAAQTIQILQSKFVQPGNQQYPNPVFWANLPAQDQKGRQYHVNYWDKKAQAQIPVQHDIGRDQPITAIVQVYDSTNPLAQAKHGGKVAHLTDIIFDDASVVNWYVPGSAAAVFAGFKPLPQGQGFKPADSGNTSDATAPQSNPAGAQASTQAPINNNNIPFNDGTQKQDPFAQPASQPTTPAPNPGLGQQAPQGNPVAPNPGLGQQAPQGNPVAPNPGLGQQAPQGNPVTPNPAPAPSSADPASLFNGAGAGQGNPTAQQPSAPQGNPAGGMKSPFPPVNGQNGGSNNPF